MHNRVFVATLLALAGLVAAPASAQYKGKAPPAKSAPKAPDKKHEEKREFKTPFKVGSETDPSIMMTDISGKTQSLKDLRGKIAVVQFWSLDAGSAVYDKALAALYAEYSKKGVVFIAIDPNKADADSGAEPYKRIQDHAAKSGLAFPIVVDNSYRLVDKFGAQTLAQSFVIDAKGILRYSGAVNDDAGGKKADKATPELKNALDALLAGKEVAPATTTPGGPAIKRESGHPGGAGAKTPPTKGAVK
jgi:peroxiredoxin